MTSENKGPWVIYSGDGIPSPEDGRFLDEGGCYLVPLPKATVYPTWDGACRAAGACCLTGVGWQVRLRAVPVAHFKPRFGCGDGEPVGSLLRENKLSEAVEKRYGAGHGRTVKTNTYVLGSERMDVLVYFPDQDWGYVLAGGNVAQLVPCRGTLAELLPYVESRYPTGNPPK